MKDDLEKYIKNNRSAFDQATPNLKVWEEIDKGLGPEKKEAKQRRIGFWRLTQIAAAVAAILAIGICIGINVSKTNGDSEQLQATNDLEMPPEILEMEQFYQSKIKEKKTKLASFEYNPILNEDLDELDDFLSELKTELMEAPASRREQIMGAMIQNYQTRIDLLERVLERIQSPKPNKLNSEKNEKIDI